MFKKLIVSFLLNTSDLVNLIATDNAKVIVHDCKSDPNYCTCPTIDLHASVKYLGFIIDQYLKWNEHIASICTVCTRKFTNLLFSVLIYLPTSFA